MESYVNLYKKLNQLKYVPSKALEEEGKAQMVLFPPLEVKVIPTKLTAEMEAIIEM